MASTAATNFQWASGNILFNDHCGPPVLAYAGHFSDNMIAIPVEEPC